MINTAVKILVVDDEKKFLNTIAERLKLLGFDPLKASSGPEAIALAKGQRIDLAVVDLKMPDMDGLVTITKLKEIQPDLKSVLLTGHGSEKVKQATEALNTAYFEKEDIGNFWNFIKQCHRDGNVIVLRPPSADTAAGSTFDNAAHVFRSGKTEADRTVLFEPNIRPDNRKDAPSTVEQFRMIGEDPAMQKLRRNIKRFAALDCSVIIYGETGVGKELAARLLHDFSPRRNQRFMAINCGCFSNDLLTEELFGIEHENLLKHTSEQSLKTGIEPGGTILLDQIEDMQPKMQLSMLKILDHNKTSQQENAKGSLFDVRILAASLHDLSKMVEEGKLKEELYFRLNVVELFIPPLKDRRDDIPPLCSYFLKRFSKEFNSNVEYISDDVISLFMSYDFPGNVRELEHVIERAVILAEGDTLETRHFPERFQKIKPTLAKEKRKIASLADIEKQYILDVLAIAGGNKSQTAALLGISRAALWRKLKQFKAE